MLSITPTEQAAWQSGTQKNLTLVFDINGTTKTLDNSDIVSESMSLRQTVSDDASNVFENVYSSEFNIRVFDDGTRYKGATLTVTISVTLENVDGYLVDSDGNRIIDSNGNYLIVNTDEDVTYTRQLGVFEVISDKLTSDGITRDLICYDSLSAILAKDYSDWHNGLTYPMTIKNYRIAFFGQVGLTQETVTLPNDSVTINKNELSTVSGATILSAVLGLNGCWGYISIDNVFHYALPRTTADYTITDNSFVQGSYAFEEFQTAEYSGIIFSNSITTTVTDGDESHEESSEQNVTVGDATGSVLNFQDNILLKDKTDAQLTAIGNTLLTTLDGFSYTPSTVTFPAYMGLELGDVFQITTSKGTYSFPVLDRKMSGITALKDTFSAEGVEYSAENANSLQAFMAQYQANFTDVSNLLNKTSKIANNANTIAGSTNQYFWHTESTVYYRTEDTTVDASKAYYELIASVYSLVTPVGTENPSEEGWYEAFIDTGAHITEVPRDDFISDPDNGGGNLLARSNGIAVRNGLTERAVFGSDEIAMYASDGNTKLMQIGVSANNHKINTSFNVLNLFNDTKVLTLNKYTASDVSNITINYWYSYTSAGYHSTTGTVTLTPSSRSWSQYPFNISYNLTGGNIVLTVVNAEGDSTISLTGTCIYTTTDIEASSMYLGAYADNTQAKLLMLGNGTGSSDKSNSFSVGYDGDFTLSGNTPTIRIETIADSAEFGVDIIKCYPANQYGVNMVVGGWGNTIVGSGESANNAYKNLSDLNVSVSAEHLLLTSDNNIHLVANANTWSNYADYIFGGSGMFFPQTKTIYGYYDTGDTSLGKLAYSALQPCSENGNTILGYGNYNYQEGATNIYGNNVNIITRNNVNIAGVRFNPLWATDGSRELWSGAYYMSATQTITLSESISNQSTGIVLCWSAYVNGSAADYDWCYTFVPKWHVSHVTSGHGAGFPLCTVTSEWGVKYLYFTTTTIKGHADNTSGNNGYWVLRRVIGV